MIHNRPLTADERHHSVRFLERYNATNGAAYACVGETMMILLAVALGCSDSVTAAIVDFLYLGFVCLPLGRVAAARIGAAKCEGLCWSLRNFFALLVASSAFWWAGGHPTAATISILVGTFGFYGCRSIGVVFHQPLIAEITLPEERSDVLARQQVLFYFFGLLAYVVISLVLERSSGIWPLVWIMGLGSLLGQYSAWCLTRIDETEALRESARRPILGEFRKILAIPSFRRLVVAGCVQNVLIMTTVPFFIVSLKKGWGVSDFSAVLWSLFSVVGSVVGSHATGPIGRRIGPRKAIIGTGWALFAVSAAWLLLPAERGGILLPVGWGLGLFAVGFSRAMAETARDLYFILDTPQPLRVSGATFFYTTLGIAAGLVGLGLSNLFLAWIGRGGATNMPGPTAVAAYKNYFALVLLLVPAMVFLVRLLPLPTDRRGAIRGRLLALLHLR